MRPRLHRDQERDPPPHPDKGGPIAPYQEKYRIFSGAGSESPLPSSYYSRSTQMPQPSHCLIFYARASPKRDSTSSRSVPADDAMQMPLILGAPVELLHSLRDVPEYIHGWAEQRREHNWQSVLWLKGMEDGRRRRRRRRFALPFSPNLKQLPRIREFTLRCLFSSSSSERIVLPFCATGGCRRFTHVVGPGRPAWQPSPGTSGGTMLSTSSPACFTAGWGRIGRQSRSNCSSLPLSPHFRRKPLPHSNHGGGGVPSPSSFTQGA